ncbi:MAG: hypothetical protein KDA92_26495, partial [Planctomycetales bacterium]|nr:hypothetical protein [Planctomycetales bacterium]
VVRVASRQHDILFAVTATLRIMGNSATFDAASARSFKCRDATCRTSWVINTGDKSPAYRQQSLRDEVRHQSSVLRPASVNDAPDRLGEMRTESRTALWIL